MQLIPFLFILLLLKWINCKPIRIINETMVAELNNPEIAFSLVSETLSPTEFGKWVSVIEGQTVLLKCAEDDGEHHKMWITPSLDVFHSANKSYESLQKFQRMQQIQRNVQAHINVLHSGHLLITDFVRDDAGQYRCFTFNDTGVISRVINVGLDDAAFRRLYNHSLYIGATTAGMFLLLVLLLQTFCYLMTRFGYKCCWGTYISPKAEKVGRLIKTIEQYKTQQLDRLNQNYNLQVSNIKETFSRQMDHLQESYTSKMQRFKDLSQHSNQQLQQIRDQYNEQCSRVGEYSMRQMNKVHDNYMDQQDRICRYTSQQLQHLKDTYTYQQKAFNKIIENIPDLNINSCLYMEPNNIAQKKASMSSSVIIERDDMLTAKGDWYNKSAQDGRGTSNIMNDSMLLAFLNESISSHEKLHNDLQKNGNRKKRQQKKHYKKQDLNLCNCATHITNKASDRVPNIHMTSLFTTLNSEIEILSGLIKEDKYNVGDKNGKMESSYVGLNNTITFGHLS